MARRGEVATGVTVWETSGPLAGIARFPRVRLGHAPTPLDAAPNLGAALGVELWIKRDDCTGLAFGGNKVRQLEFELGEAQARGADTVLVTGAVQSNMVRLTASGARRLGMEAHVQLEDRVKGDGELYRTSGNLLLNRMLGATLHAFPVGEDEAAAGEVMEQARALGIGFDAVVCASGSALTQAGTLVGMRALGERTPVYGICVRREARAQGARVAKLAAMIGRPAAFEAADVEVDDGVLPPGYGRLNDAVREAMAMAARHEALLLDPVYTGKTMAGLIAQVRAGRIAAGSRVLFIHTGGQPALFAYAGRLGPWLSKAPPTFGHDNGDEP